MWRSVMHVVRCLASHIHLRHWATCVLHPHPKHQYLDICTWRTWFISTETNSYTDALIHCSYCHAHAHAHLAQIFISTHAFSQNMPKTTDGHKYLCTTLHMHMHKYGTAETQHMPCMGTYMLWINVCVGWYWNLFIASHVRFINVSVCGYLGSNSRGIYEAYEEIAEKLHN